MSVLASVLDHGRIERSLTPVGLLILFLCLNLAEFLKQIAERIVRIVEDTRGLTRVEHVHHVDAEIFLQPLDVRVGAVQDFGERPVGEDLVETMHVGAQLDRVHDKVVSARRDLHETREALERSVRVVLEIHGDLFHARSIRLAQMVAQPL